MSHNITKEKQLFGRRLIKARVDRGWCQTELSKQTGINRSIIAHLEEGSNFPSFNTLIILKKTLGCSLDYLCGLSEYCEIAAKRIEETASQARF